MTSVLGPKVSLTIDGNAGVFEAFVSAVTVERSLDKATLISITLANPFVDAAGSRRTSKLAFTDSAALQPGGVVEVFAGYDRGELIPLGAGVIRRWNPSFPRSDTPTITIKALDGLALMMDGTDGVNATEAIRFEPDTSLIDIVLSIVKRYGFDTSNVDTSTPVPTLSVPAQKKAGTTDYQFVRSIANSIGWEFFAEFDHVRRQWFVFFRPPVPDQSAKQVFTWGPDFEAGGVGGLLLDFDVDFATHGTSTDVEVFYFDRGARIWEKIEWPPPDKKAKGKKRKEFEWKGDDTTIEADLQAVGDADGARGLRIQASGVSVEVIPATGFRSSEEAVAFARQWWEARQSTLITGTGTTIGYPLLQPGQVHTLRGIGEGLSGDWYIAETTHRFLAGGDRYTTAFTARKAIP